MQKNAFCTSPIKGHKIFTQRAVMSVYLQLYSNKNIQDNEKITLRPIKINNS